MAWAGELATAAFDAARNVVLLCAFPILKFALFAKQVGLQSHRTCTDALGTADAGTGLGTARFLVVHDEQAA